MDSSEVIYNYSHYLVEHIRRVRRAIEEFLKTEEFGISPYNNPDFIAEMHVRSDNHDKSKWSIEEFFPYAEHYYGKHSEHPDMEDPAYDKAWEHHVASNDHHDGYWRQEGRTPEQAPIESVFEMLCDWTSMSVFSGGYPSEWYNRNKGEVLEGYPSETLSVIDEYIPVFDRIYEILRNEEESRK